MNEVNKQIGIFISITMIITIATLTVMHAHGQPAAKPTNTTGQQQPIANLSKIIAKDKQLQTCLNPSLTAGLPSSSRIVKNPCYSLVHVLYQSPSTVALSSRYVDIIWKAVDIAKHYGYKVDGITSYTTRSELETSGSINILVSMSR
jgi:hypothetical protein